MYRKNIPIPSLRAVLLIALAAYLLAFPARASSDIIASGFAVAAFSICTFFFWLLAVSARNIRKNLAINFSVAKERQHFSNTAITALIRLSEFRIPGLIRADMQLESEMPGPEFQIHQLSVNSVSDPIISEQMNFPHRGNWNIKSCSIYLYDPLGFFTVGPLKFEINQIVEIYPEPSDSPGWNAISSSIKEDDSLPHPTERKGEHYDFKHYHPSDGSRRIIWKFLARSGELFSRHPEPAYSPEGKIGIYCFALKDDDLLADQSLNFIRQLEEQSIETRLGCLSSSENIAASFEQAGNNLLEHTWLSQSATRATVISGLEKLISGLSVSGSIPQSLCLAISESSLNQAFYRELIIAADQALTAKNITAHYLISKKATNLMPDKQKTQHLKILNLFIESTQNLTPEETGNGTAFIAQLEKSNSQIQWSS